MPRVALQKLFLLLMQVAWIDFLQHTKADAIRNCTKFTSCIDSYADIYKSLTLEENSFNIESALYPAIMPSSLVVKVQIHGPNETSIANYTWSVNCLYVAIPAEVIQLLSLGSILVTPRTQDLNICIPYFCSNVSSDEEQKDLMKGVLAALQDLAVSPGIRDPRLNTAECVIEGHKTDITATGRSWYIRAILWCSFIVTFLLGPFLVVVLLGGLKTYSTDHSDVDTALSTLSPGPSSSRTTRAREALVSSIMCLCYLLFCIETVVLGFVFKSSVSANAPIDIYVIFGVLLAEGASALCFTSPRCCTCDCLVTIITAICANLTVYHFCWLVIGIMINPTWGLAVLLIVFFFGIALTYTFYKIFNVKNYKCKPKHIKHIIKCIVTFCGVCSFVLLAVLAGQSFYGRETADDVMKTVLLYVISGLISWVSWQKDLLQRNEESRQDGGNNIELENTQV